MDEDNGGIAMDAFQLELWTAVDDGWSGNLIPDTFIENVGPTVPASLAVASFLDCPTSTLTFAGGVTAQEAGDYALLIDHTQPDSGSAWYLIRAEDRSETNNNVARWNNAETIAQGFFGDNGWGRLTLGQAADTGSPQ